MLTPSFSESLARSGFAHRGSRGADDQIVYRLVDGSGAVRVPAAEWRRLGREMELALKPLRRRTRWLSIAWAPGIMIYGFTLGQVLPFGMVPLLAAIFLGPPAIYLQHSHGVQAIRRAIEADLATLPRCEPPAERPGAGWRWFDIAFLLLVGPGLLLAVIGEIGGPDIFRGTPWWGTDIGAFEVVGMLLIAVRVIRLRRNPRLVRF